MFDFDHAAPIEGWGSLKNFMTPAGFREKNIPTFAAAEMDFRTAPSVIEAVTRAAQSGVYGFTIPDDRYFEAVRWWMREVRGWEIEKDWIVPTLGTIYSVAMAIRMCCRPGIEAGRMIVQRPVYFRYEQAARRMGIETVSSDLVLWDDRYFMDLADLEEKMADPQNKLLVICNAHNPVGKVWTEAELREVAKLSARYQVPVLSDEIFGELAFGGHRVTPYASIEEGRALTMTITSLGKAFNFTGVNHANVIIPDEDLRQRFVQQKYADHYGSMGIFEYASVLGAYCPDGRDWFYAARSYIEENANMVTRFFESEVPEGYLFPVEGTTVGWIDFSALGLKGEALTDFLREKALLDVESGIDYDEKCASFIRMNLSSTRKSLTDALSRLRKAAAENRSKEQQVTEGGHR